MKNQMEQVEPCDIEEDKELKTPKEVKYDWVDLEEDIDLFCLMCKANNQQFTGVYGLPRGGLIPAVMISHRLSIPLLMAPYEGCLIIDDIADSGRSLMHYTKNDTQFNRYYIYTLFYVERSLVKPDFYSHLKKQDGWITFPWEKESCKSV